MKPKTHAQIREQEIDNITAMISKAKNTLTPLDYSIVLSAVINNATRQLEQVTISLKESSDASH